MWVDVYWDKDRVRGQIVSIDYPAYYIEDHEGMSHKVVNYNRISYMRKENDS